MAIRGITDRKATSSNRDPSLTSLSCQVALSLYRDKWTTIIRLWWLSQWLVTHGHHLAVAIYLHVGPSSGRHITSLSIILKFYHFYHTFNSQFTSSTLTLWFKTIINGGCYWEGLMAFLPGPLSGAICCSIHCRILFIHFFIFRVWWEGHGTVSPPLRTLVVARCFLFCKCWGNGHCHDLQILR